MPQGVGVRVDNREMACQFVGTVMASFTHEMQNHLATIHEAAGLQEDMVCGGKPLDRQRIGRLSAMTTKHVGCALGLIRCLNRYAHRLDQGISSFNVNDVLEELFALTGRVFRQKMIDVQTLFHPGLQEVRNDPVLLQSLIFTILERKATSCGEGGTVTIRTRPTKGAVKIELVSTGGALEVSGQSLLCDDKRISSLVAALNADITSTPGVNEVTLYVPSLDRL